MNVRVDASYDVSRQCAGIGVEFIARGKRDVQRAWSLEVFGITSIQHAEAEAAMEGIRRGRVTGVAFEVHTDCWPVVEMLQRKSKAEPTYITALRSMADAAGVPVRWTPRKFNKLADKQARRGLRRARGAR